MKIVVTGTSGGIGGAVARAARAAGHSVVDVNRADFAREGELVREDGVDAVVFATGVCPVAPLSKTDDELLVETFRVNCALFARLMRELAAGGRFSPYGAKAIAVSSVSATEGWPGGVAYCASKGALSAVCRAMDAELRGRGVRVVAVEPRYVKTAMFDGCAGRMGVPASAAEAPEAFAERILALLCGK